MFWKGQLRTRTQIWDGGSINKSWHYEDFKIVGEPVENQDYEEEEYHPDAKTRAKKICQ